MATYIINGGNKLKGTLKISGNKNAILPCMAASLLTEEEIVLHNVPQIKDVEVLGEILESVGVSLESSNNTLKMQALALSSTTLPEHLTNKLRGSVLLAGSMLGRKGEVSFYHPGGDVIGKRAIEQHLEGFEKLGFKATVTDKKYTLSKTDSEIRNNHIFLELPTVTGTENLLLCAVLLEGLTVIRNAAQEPHIVDLCNLLVKMGANIKGVGTNTLEITGVEKLHGAEFTIGPDHMEFGTYAVAAAITGGEIEFKNCGSLDIDPIAWPFEKMGLKIDKIEDGFRISADQLKAIDTNFPFTANFWPGFPTDLMSAMIVLATQATGTSLLRDYIYESRMVFVDKLISMGAQIVVGDPHRVTITGPSKLTGKELDTPDIRAGMALVLASLVAEGESTIHRAELIERGYEDVVGNLSKLGANIKRVDS